MKFQVYGFQIYLSVKQIIFGIKYIIVDIKIVVEVFLTVNFFQFECYEQQFKQVVYRIRIWGQKYYVDF